MKDFDSIWRTQDETTEQRGPSELARRWPSRDGVRKNFKSERWSMLFWVRSALPLATEGTQECIWNLSFNERRMAIELELTKYLEEEEVDMLINQFPVTADFDGVGSKGTKFVFYM